jgi:hypothetical protein
MKFLTTQNRYIIDIIFICRDNFLDVDFYFEEMSIEKITERPAYDEESLFGEYQMNKL